MAAAAPSRARLDLAARGIRGLVRTPFELAGRARRGAAPRPSRSLHAAREAIEGVGEIAWATLNPAPETPLNVEIGPHRRFVFLREELDDFKLVKNAFGGTVNDVVLDRRLGRPAEVAALARHAHRGARAARARPGLDPRPRRSAATMRQPARGRCAGRCRSTSRTRSRGCRSCAQSMDGLKESKQAVGAEVLAGVQNFAPPTVLAQASRLNFSTRLFNLLVTNVPGPQFPLYVLGRELQDLFPVAFLPRQPCARGGDHVLQRRDGLRPARRLRRDARPRRVRRDGRRLAQELDAAKRRRAAGSRRPQPKPAAKPPPKRRSRAQ